MATLASPRLAAAAAHRPAAASLEFRRRHLDAPFGECTCRAVGRGAAGGGDDGCTGTCTRAANANANASASAAATAAAAAEPVVVASVTLARDVPAHIEGRHVLLRRLEGARDDVEELVGDILTR